MPLAPSKKTPHHKTPATALNGYNDEAVNGEHVKKQKFDDMMGVLAIRDQLKTDKKSKWVIDPRTSTFVTVWDGVQMAALIFTAFVTPFQVAFLEAAKEVDRCEERGQACQRREENNEWDSRDHVAAARS